MPEWTPKLLLFVFVTHMPFFAWRWRRTGEVRFAFSTLTFALLIVTYSLRIFAADVEWFGTSAYMWFRVPAWISAIVSVGLLLRHVAMRWRGGA
jgi:hypothetical protein